MSPCATLSYFSFNHIIIIHYVKDGKIGFMKETLPPDKQISVFSLIIMIPLSDM